MTNDFLKRLTDLTETNISNSLFGADELAREMGLSHSTLLRKVRSHTGKSINQYIRDMRLQKALELLQQEEITVAEVAYRTGFGSAAYFSNCFSEHFGFPPGEARKHNNIRRGDPWSPVKNDPRPHANITRKPRKLRGTQAERVVVSGIAGLVVVAVVIILITLLGNSERAQTKRLKARQKTITVLPFEPIGSDTTKQPISDGFRAELQGRLGDMNGLVILPAMPEKLYQHILQSGKDPRDVVNADYVMEGKVGLDANKLKVWLYLNEKKSHSQIWSFDTLAEMKDIFLQVAEITQTITSELVETLSPQEIGRIPKKHTQNEEALGYYYQGNYYSNIDRSVDIKAAMECYQKAIDQDPQFALPYLRIADVMISMRALRWDLSEKNLVESKRLIDKAMELDPGLPDAHYVLGHYFSDALLQYEEGLKEYDLALKEQPDHFLALFRTARTYLFLKNHQKAVLYANRALKVNPRSVSCLNLLGNLYKTRREYEKADETFHRSLEVNPWYPGNYTSLAKLSIEWKGDTGRARMILDEGVRLNPAYDDTDLLLFDYQYYLIDVLEGKYEQALNRINGPIMDRLRGWKKEYFPGVGVYENPNRLRAQLYGLMGKPELERAYYDSTRIYLENLDSTHQKNPNVITTEGIVYAALGLEKKALDKVRLLMESNTIYAKGGTEGVAQIYTLLGKYPEALEQIRLCLDNQGKTTTSILELDPRWETLRNLPEYKKLMKEYRIK